MKLSDEQIARESALLDSSHSAVPVGQTVPGEGWRPIATAPKDKGGPDILLSNGVAVSQGWWVDEPGYSREVRDMDGHYIDQDESDGYMGWLDCDGGMQPDPTHWMPLPPAPGSQADTDRHGSDETSAPAVPVEPCTHPDCSCPMQPHGLPMCAGATIKQTPYGPAIRGDVLIDAERLHAAIMNLPCKFEAAWQTPAPSDWVEGYVNGHRDTRYAAAELAMKAKP